VAERIQIKKEKDKTIVTIFPLYDKQKSNLMTVWMVLWLACGAVVLYELFANHSREEKLVLAVYMVFWTYFAYRIARMLRWRKSGREVITFHQDKVLIGKFVGERGLETSYAAKDIQEVKAPEVNKVSFAAVFNHSYWMEGSEALIFTCGKTKVAAGLQLSEAEQKKLFREFTRLLSQARQ
jgi:hypothetical protein